MLSKLLFSVLKMGANPNPIASIEDEFSVEEFVVGIEIPSLHPEDEEEVK